MSNCKNYVVVNSEDIKEQCQKVLNEIRSYREQEWKKLVTYKTKKRRWFGLLRPYTFEEAENYLKNDDPFFPTHYNIMRTSLYWERLIVSLNIINEGSSKILYMNVEDYSTIMKWDIGE